MIFGKVRENLTEAICTGQILTSAPLVGHFGLSTPWKSYLLRRHQAIDYEVIWEIHIFIKGVIGSVLKYFTSEIGVQAPRKLCSFGELQNSAENLL